MAIITNAKGLVKDFFLKVQSKVYPQELALADKLFQQKKAEIVNLIRTHPVSQELINHTSPSRILGTPGTLFGFVGFPVGFKPVDKIIEITEQKTTYKIRKKLLGRGFILDLTLPEIRDYRVGELMIPWEGGYSFVDAIERGISGLNFYIATRTSPNSRSKEGIQSRHPMRQRHFRGRLYMSEIIERLRNEGRRETLLLKGNQIVQ